MMPATPETDRAETPPGPRGSEQGSPRVLQVVLSLAPGGTERLVVELSQRLHLRYGMAVCCLDEPGAWADGLEQAGIPVTALGRRPGFRPSLGARIAKIAERDGATVLHCHHYSPFVYGTLAALRGPLKVVFTEHGRFTDSVATLKRRIANRVWSRMPSKIFSVSQDLRGHLIREGFSGGRIGVIYNGIDPGDPPSERTRLDARARLNIRPDELVVGAVGRLDPVKSLDTLITALSHLKSKSPRIRLVLIGGGPMKDVLVERVKQQGLEDDVAFTGHRDDVTELLPALDVYVNCSIFEGVSLTILEAMAAAIPVIATRVGGTPEVVVDDETGCLVPARDPAALANAIGALMGQPLRRYSLGRAGRARVEQHFSITRMVEDYAAVYDQMGRLS
jgi:glycosyltransferase involved in cell wall biosynthesis